MPLKSLKTSTAGQKSTFLVQENVAKEKLPKALLSRKSKSGGRNAHGHVTVRHRGGGCKRFLREVDFSRLEKKGVVGTVNSFHFDPNRSANLALIFYSNGEKGLILAPKNLKIGDRVVCDEQAKIKLGNRMRLKNIPVGWKIFNLELRADCGGQLVRSAGASATLSSLDGEMAQVKLPSGEVRLFHKDCFATIGEVGNEDH